MGARMWTAAALNEGAHMPELSDQQSTKTNLLFGRCLTPTIPSQHIPIHECHNPIAMLSRIYTCESGTKIIRKNTARG